MGGGFALPPEKPPQSPSPQRGGSWTSPPLYLEEKSAGDLGRGQVAQQQQQLCSEAAWLGGRRAVQQRFWGQAVGLGKRRAAQQRLEERGCRG